MNILAFLASIVQSLAWPAVVVFLVYLLRDSITDLIPRLRRFKHKDTELEFDVELKAIEATFTPITKSLKDSPANPTTRTREIDRLLDIVDISPRASVVEAWILIESLLSKIASKVPGLEKSCQSIPSMTLLKILRDKHFIDNVAYKGLQEMRILRNRAAHSEDFGLTIDGARRYLELTKEIISTLEQNESQ